jgi:hypothetical protein
MSRHAYSIVAVMGLAACLAPPPAGAQSGKWVATIPMLTTVRGEAKLTVTALDEKQSRAVLAIRGSQGEASLAWEIAEGRCGMNAPAIMPIAAFPKITTRLDGSGQANPKIQKLVSGKQYYLRVYSPMREALTDASAFGCANLSEAP